MPDIAPGVYELVGTQEPPETQTALRGVPARARVVVTDPGGAQPAPAGETQPLGGLTTLKESAGPSTATLVLVGLAMFVLTVGAAMVPTLATRRRAA